MPGPPSSPPPVGGPMEVDEEPPSPPPEGFTGLWKPKPLPPLAGFVGVWTGKAQPASAPPTRRPAGLALGPVPPRINPSVWDSPPEPAGPPPSMASKEGALAKVMPVPANTSPGPLITSATIPDQVFGRYAGQDRRVGQRR
jgi:hypothetical protein